MHNFTNRQLALLAGVVVVIGFLLTFFGTASPKAPTQSSDQPVQTAARVAPPQPTMTASDTTAALQGNSFQLLISYADTGFEPQTADISAGQTVRFTNNSSGELWIASSAAGQGGIYPGPSSWCGGSALDSCGALPPGQFWQFTFTHAGTWEFVNNLDKSNAGTITVH